MATSDSASLVQVLQAVAELVEALAWPLVVLGLVAFLAPPLRRFLDNAAEFSVKAGPTGFEASAKKQVAAAAMIGAAKAAKEAARAAVAAGSTREGKGAGDDVGAEPGGAPAGGGLEIAGGDAGDSGGAGDADGASDAARAMAAERRILDATTAATTAASAADWSSVADTVARAVEPRTARRLDAGRVLWVDDYPANNLFERRALEALGLRVVTATSTDEGLDRAATAAYDLVITDMGRPGDERAGYTLLERLRAAGRDVPLVVYSAGGGAPEHVAEARRRGAAGSTGDPERLVELVTGVVGGG